MSSFLYRVGRAAYRHRGRSLLVWLLVIIIFGASAAALSKPFDNGFRLPGTESQQALDALSTTFPQVSGTTGQVVVVAPEGAKIRDTDVRDAIDASIERLEKLPQVDSATSPFDKNIDGAINDAGTAAVINVQLDTDLAGVEPATLDNLTDEATELQQDLPGSQVSAGGQAFQTNSFGFTITEVFGVIIALVVLMITLGSFRAAGMPLLTALLGVGISMSLVLLSTALATVNSTTPLLALMLGLAVGIDYALFIVSRHRDQLAAGLEPEESVAQAVATAGSAVVFAGLTVMIALLGLSVAGIPFLTTMGVAAAVAVAVAVLIALTLLPALLGYAGARLAPKPRKARKGEPAKAAHSDQPSDHPSEKPSEKRGWTGWWVTIVTKVPLLTIVVVVVGLGALALPARDLVLALPDNGTNEAGTPARVTYDLLSKEFGPGFNGPLVVTADIVGSDDPLGVMDGIADRIKGLPGVASVPLATPNEGADTGIVQVVPTTAPDAPETADLVRAIRALQPEFEDEYEVQTAVTGATAVQIDVSSQLGQALLPFGILVVGLSLILLTMVFRSIAVPIKATLGFLLSVGASFGLITLGFGEGHFADLLNIEKPGPVLSFLPILLMGILFGLAMDYEVFLVSRIREDYVHGPRGHQGARAAVYSGFRASAKVVVAAAVIMFSVFAAFVPEGDAATIKGIAFGLAAGVFVDAFIVRMTLVPAVLALLGERAWYLPRWLDRVLPSFDVEGEALHHQLALADFPYAGADHVVAVQDLAITDRHGSRVDTVVADAELFVEPGRVGVVESVDAGARTAFLLALTGRTRIASGRAKIAGLALPEQAGQLRSVAVHLDADDPDGFARAVRAVTAKTRLVVVDHADDPDERVAAMITELIDLTVAVDASHRAVVLGVGNAAAVASLIPAASPLLELPDRRPGHTPAAADRTVAYA